MNKFLWKTLNLAFKRNSTLPQSLPQKIIVMLNGQLGDVVQTTPVLKAIRDKWPDACVDYCVRKNASYGLEGNPNIRHIIFADEYGPWSITNPIAMYRLAAKIRKNNYAIALCLGNDPTYGTVVRMAGIKYIAGIIDSEYKTAFLDEYYTVPYDDTKPRVLNYKTLGEKVGLVFQDTILPEVHWKKEDEDYIDSLLEVENKKYVAIFSGSGPNAYRPWAKRSWPASKWAELIKLIARENSDITFLLLGKDKDAIVNSEIINEIKDIKTINLTDKTTFTQLAYVLSKSRLLISTDSSPVFAAASVNCPTLVLYGPEWPERARPVGMKDWCPVSVEFACRKYCASFPQKAPICNNECMKNISLEKVYQSAKDRIKD